MADARSPQPSVSRELARATRGRGTQDVIGFRRIFILYCSLVLAPALLMSGFAVSAIVNERAADKQRRHDRAAAVLRTAEARLGQVLTESDRIARSAFELEGTMAGALLAGARKQGAPIGAFSLFGPDQRVLAASGAFRAVDGPVAPQQEPEDGARPEEPPASPLMLRLQDLSARAAPGTAAHALIDDPQFDGVISLQKHANGRALVYALDEERLSVAIAAHADDPEMRVQLAVVARNAAPINNAVERLMDDIVRARSEGLAATEREVLAERRLDAPFDRFTLRVDADQSHTSTRTTVIYVTLLVVFLSTLITGVVITARLIWHETRLSRLKTDFVSHMSHELRTPLTSIRMFIETLKIGNATSPEEQAECLALLAKETERLTDMIERVLGYARLKAGRRLFAPTAIPAARIVDDAIDAFRAQNLDIEHGGSVPAVLVTEIAPALPAVFADRDALVEALLNLIMNAYKYTGPDKRITVFAREGRRGRVLLGVQDNGPGVPKSEHRRVFERFYQGGNLLSTKQPGSGLGLAITQAIVEGNGGRISLESEPGAGACFTIELRRAA